MRSESSNTTSDHQHVAVVRIEPKQMLRGDIVKLSLPLNHPESQHNNNKNNDGDESHKKEPKGRNVSGRSWKVRPQKRASTLVKTRANNQTKSWEKRQAEKLARQEALELQKQMHEEKRQAILLKKERRLENEKRRAENEVKAIEKSVQTLNVTKVGSTLKAMSKKQLRQIKKTRVNTRTGVVEYVPAYQK